MWRPHYAIVFKVGNAPDDKLVGTRRCFVCLSPMVSKTQSAS